MQFSSELLIVGRDTEKARWQQLLQKGDGLLAFYGIGGSGKTTLLRLLYQETPKEHTRCMIPAVGEDILMLVDNILDGWQDSCIDQPEFAGIVQRTRTNLDSEKSKLYPQIYQSISATRGSVVQNVTQTVNIPTSISKALYDQVSNRVQQLFLLGLRDLSAHTQVCLFFDALDKPGTEIEQFLESLVGHAYPNVVIAITGRHQCRLLRNPLLPLGNEEVIRLLQAINVPESFHARIMQLARGHGLCVRLLINYVTEIPTANLEALYNYDLTVDPASLIQIFWEDLILQPIEGLYREYSDSKDSKAERFGRIAILLRYGPSLYDFAPEVIYAVFRNMAALKQHFPKLATVQESLLDPIVATYFQLRKRRQYHDLIREVGDISLASRFPQTYRALHRVAAQFHKQQLVKVDKREKIDPPTAEAHKALLDPEYPLVLLSLDWRKNPQKQVLLQTAWPSLSARQLYAPEFEEWRFTLEALCYHLFRYSERAGAQILDRTLEQTFARTHTPLCQSLIKTTRYLPKVSPNIAAWLLYLQATIDKYDRIPTLERLFNNPKATMPVQIKVAFELAKHYASLDASQAERYLLFLQEHSDEISVDEQATFWRELASIALRRDTKVLFLQQAVAASGTSWDKADSLQKLGIEYRKQDDYVRGQEALEQSLNLWLETKAGEKIGETYIALGDLCRLKGEIQQAREWYEQSGVTLRQAEAEYRLNARQTDYINSLIGMSMAAVARCRIATGERTVAIKELERAIKLHQDYLTASRHPLGWELRLLGQLYDAGGEPERAKSYFMEAATVTPSLEHRAQAKCCLADLLYRQGQIDEGNLVRQEVEQLIQQLDYKTFESLLKRVRSELDVA